VDDPDLENGSCKTESALEQIPIPCGARATLFQSKSSWTPAVATPLISLGVASQLSSPAKAGDDAPQDVPSRRGAPLREAWQKGGV